jgi:hypothetical protein
VAKAVKDRLTFEEGQQQIGAEYDDLLILGVEDPAAVDTLAERYRRHTTLAPLLKELIEELAQFSPQHYVHAKTLYSAVNLVRRCPPAPIFATLRSHPDFVNRGGAYWQLA